MSAHVNPMDRRYSGEHPVRTVAYLLADDKARLALAVVAFAVKHSPTWLLPLVTANVIDVVVQHRPIGELWLNTLLLLAALALNYPFHVLFVRCLSTAVRRMGTGLRSALVGRMQQLSIGYHTRMSAGVLQNKVIRDVESIETMVQQAGDMGLAATMMLVGGLVVIAVRVPVFLPVFLVLVPCAALLAMKLRNRMRTDNEVLRREVEQLSTRVSEMTTLIPITRAHGLERAAMRRVDGTLSRVLDAGLRVDLVNGRFGALSWMSLNMIGVACLAGSALVAYYGWAPITAGDVVMLSAYFGSLTTSVIMLMNLGPQIMKGLESVRSVGEVLQAPDLERNAGRATVDQVRGAIDFHGVGYAYDTVQAVRDFTLSVAPGERIAFVGPSGAGKSTVLNLVIGFLRPTSGRILLDGRDMEELDLRSYRTSLSIVPQEPILFEGSITENVTYGMTDVSPERVRQALADANALEFVDALPEGEATVVGDRGARLSGGQRQRLAIARALIRDPRVLILDEATSALDTHSERLIQEALERLVRGRTVFVVAHRLSTIRNADRIVVMRDGRIEEVGPHDDLVTANGAYARLQAAQLV
ncbi:ATP-binding cassette subfamily B protein [Allocatelliglobosispora scoriae]|uniref:ATP-binding cassette subfamily B protein n=1 Tax=Allocatelliglobosispora scoriae TaxID=643052 RepID=A0A841BM20_9ACTN|nr:ABC transporter ATP-binding protein [Allocatelliglobosispora scoriae]MBB5868705.1 ATP-binding cassette subfamily B protein [Allocatelliglobosispora scoriae]